MSKVRSDVKKHLQTIKSLNAKVVATEERNGHVEEQNIAYEIEISELKSQVEHGSSKFEKQKAVVSLTRERCDMTLED